MIDKSVIKKIANECIYDTMHNAEEGCFIISAFDIREKYGFSLEEIVDSLEEIDDEVFCNRYGVDVLESDIYQKNNGDWVIDGIIGLFWAYLYPIYDEIMLDEDTYVLEYYKENKEIRFQIPNNAVPDTERELLDYIIKNIYSDISNYDIYIKKLSAFCRNNGEWIYKKAKEKGLVINEVTFDV